MRALVAAIRKEAKVAMEPERRSEIPWKWALALLDAYERNEIYLPELELAAKSIEEAGEIIRAPMRKAFEIAGRAGMTLSPPWQEAYRRATSEGLAEVKRELKRRLAKAQAG